MQAGWKDRKAPCHVAGRADEHFAWERPADGANGRRRERRWWQAGTGRALSLEDGLLVEYDLASRAPVGLVFLAVGEQAPSSDGLHAGLISIVPADRGRGVSRRSTASVG